MAADWEQQWADLAAEIAEYATWDPHPLTKFPDPRIGGRTPPVDIRLAAWAHEVAAHLHERYGTAVRLRLGAFPFPMEPKENRPAAPRSRPGSGRPTSTTPSWTDRSWWLPGTPSCTGCCSPDCAASGKRCAPTVTLTAAVVDPATGARVGGYVGGQKLPGVTVHLEPGVTVPVPLLVGTASTRRSLGYAVPPGDWAVRADLKLTSRQLRTPLLALTVTPG